jgi:hypothetical protein
VKSRVRGTTAGSRPTSQLAKADDAEEEGVDGGGLIGGPPETWPWWRMVTLHLQPARRSSIPISSDGRTLQGRNYKVKRKRYSRKFQRMAVERMRTCESVTELARALGAVTPRCLYKWRAKLDLLEGGEESARTSTHGGSTASRFSL